jgi:hypothetical protein
VERAVTGERGFALVTVLLLTIGLAVLAMAHAFAASQQATLMSSMHDVLRARYAAEAGVTIALRDWNAARRSLDPLGAAVELHALALEPGLNVSVTSERRAPEVFMIAATAHVERGGLAPIRHSAARVIRSLDAEAVLGSLDAAIIAATITLAAGATVRGDGSGTADTSAAALCERWPAVGAALRAPPDSVNMASGATLSGSPLLIADDSAAGPDRRHGALDLDALRAHAQLLGDSVVLPPVEPTLAYAPGNLVVHGGAAAGILIVDGDLTLSAGARFRGILVVLGTLTLVDASAEGTVIARAVDLQRGAVALDRCAIAESLAALDATRSAYLPSRSWLPTFD